MKKPGLFILGLIIFLLVVAGVLIVMTVNHSPPPSRAMLVQSGSAR